MKSITSLFQFILALVLITLPSVALADGGYSSDDDPGWGLLVFIFIVLVIGGFTLVAVLGKPKDGGGR